MVANPRFIDLTGAMPGGYNERPRVEPQHVRASVGLALEHSGLQSLNGSLFNRQDGKRYDTQDVIDTWRVHAERTWIRNRQDSMRHFVGRNDSVGFAGVGAPGFPRDFEHVRAKVWEEKRRPLNALDLFPIDTGVPLGAKTHTARRHIGQGRAELYRGGSDLPLAQGAYVEETFGTAIIVCAVNQNLFESQTVDYAGLRNYELDLRLGRRLVEEKINEIAWFGDMPTNLYGLFNYPSMATQIMNVPFTDASDPKLVLRALQDLGATPMIVSGTRFSPNRVVVGTKIKHFLSTRKHEVNGGSDMTIEQFWLSTNSLGIAKIEQAQELDNVGPNGESAIYFYRDDIETLSTCMIQAPTVLPVYQAGPFDQQTIIYAALGGAVGGDIGNNIVGLVETIEF